MFKKLVRVILAFGLMVTFLERFINLTDKLYPERSYIVIQGATYPKNLYWVYSLNNVLGSQTSILILLFLSLFAFVYEIMMLIKKVIQKPKTASVENDDD